MTKARTRRKPAPVFEPLDGPTPEQFANGDYERVDMIHADTAQRVTVHLNRQFRTHHLDRLAAAGQLTDEQYAAGMWYRDKYEACRYDSPKTATLHRIQGGLGMAITDSRSLAREAWRNARLALPVGMIGLIDGLILHNKWPKMHHRARFRTLKSVRDALDCLVHHIRYNAC